VKRLQPPSGQSPPSRTPEGVALEPLAEQVADLYFAEFPDDLERYGPYVRDWEVHDTQWLLAWASMPMIELSEQVDWLARVLEARAFPLERLARNLELAADVAAGPLPDAAPLLRDAAGQVRAR
jgi:hypothetical protein